MLGREDGLYPEITQPWTYGSDQPVEFQTGELAQLVDKMVAEYNDLAQKNSKLRSTIDQQERDCFLLSHPQFLETELKKVHLEIESYLLALHDIEEQSAATLAAMRNAKND